MLGKTEGTRRAGRGRQRVRRLHGTADSMDVNLSKLRKAVRDREPGMLQFTGRKELDMA